MPLISTQQRQPGYNIHPVDIPADHVRHEKPSRIPTFETDVVGVTVLCTILAGMLFGAVFSSARLGIGLGGGFGLLVAIWRVWFMLSDPWYEVKETSFQNVRANMAAGNGNRSIPVFQAGEQRTEVAMRNPKRLTDTNLGREYSFEGWQLDRMLDWLNKGYESVRRDTSAHGPGLSEIGITAATYSIVNQLFQNLGLIGQDGKWTEAGREWLRTE